VSTGAGSDVKTRAARESPWV